MTFFWISLLCPTLGMALMHTPEERQMIESLREDPAAKKGHEIHLQGLQMGPQGAWILWINGQKVTAQHPYPSLVVEEVTPSFVRLRHTDTGTVFKLAPNGHHRLSGAN